MVTMKTKHFLGMMASAWMLAACSNQDELLQQDELVAEQCVTVNAYVPDGTGSRLAYDDQGASGLKVSWKESAESFSVMTETEAEPVTFTQTEGSTFAGPDGFTFTEGMDYYAFYPELTEDMLGYDLYTGDPLTTVSATAIPFNFKNQTGQLDENMNLMYAKRSPQGNFQFQHMLAVMKFTLKGIEGKLVQNVDLSFTHESVQYDTDGKVNVTGENPVFSVENPIDGLHISAEGLQPDGDGNYVVYAYLPPLEADTNVSIVAYSEDEENNILMTWRDEFAVKSEGIQAGYYYTAARTMETNEEENVKLNHTVDSVEELKDWIDAELHYSGANLTLTADIDLTGTGFDYDNDYNGTNESNWHNGLWITGTVDGNGYSIKGITINSGEENQAAPFYIESTGVVKNLHLKDVNIKGHGVGGIAFENYGIISGCSVSGSLEDIGFQGVIGGMVLNNNSEGQVVGCYCIADMKLKLGTMGGIVMDNQGAVTACYSTSGFSCGEAQTMYCGGVVAQNYGFITACYWNCTGARGGISNDFNSQTATKVDDEAVTWETAREAMNQVLSDIDDFGDWRYKDNNDDDGNEPLILGVPGNEEFVPV